MNKQITYAQLLETNNLIQNCGDETYWLCLTRTVQGSKLFPVSPYILLSYLNAFYRYPSLLRKIESRMRAEDIADRARNMGMKIQNSALGWALPNFYLLGRELLLSLGFLRAQDALRLRAPDLRAAVAALEQQETLDDLGARRAM